MIRSSSNLGMKLGALVAATSLMLAGGTAVASAAYAKDKPNNGNGGNSSAPGQNSAGGPGGAVVNDPNGGADQGTNGGANKPGENQNGSNGKGGTGTLSIDVCHATRSASNPYVFITVDFSSVDEAYLFLTTNRGNGHGEHVGQIWDGQRSGVNWGDIIESISGTLTNGKEFVYPGYNLGANSVALGGTGSAILANGCNPLKPLPATLCVIATGATADFPDGVDSQAYKDAVAQTTVYSTTFPCGGTVVVCVDGENGPFQPGNKCNPGTESFTAESGLFLCEVSGNSYNGVSRVAGSGGPEASQTAAQKAADDSAVAAAYAKATGDNIIPPATFTSGAAAFPGYNWNEKTQARFDAGCSPNQSVIAANVLPGTIATPASGKPAPGKVTVPAAGAPLPGSVPAGDGSSLPGLPVWALAMLVIGALGAAASGAQILGSRK